MATKTAQTTYRRRPKHDPRDSEQEILRAAEHLIRERPLREVTVAAIMSQTGLKRPAFWTHFRDLNDVITRITERITQDLVAASDQWLSGSASSERDLVDALARATLVYTEHAPIMRALADAAPNDAQAEAAYTAIVESIANPVAARIEAEQSAERIAMGLDPDETARALVWMNERYLYHATGREQQPDIDTMAQTLSQIWLATLYGTTPQTGSSDSR
jgi:AcrR family transcriptional regulator